MILKALNKDLETRKLAGLHRQRREVESACGPECNVDGHALISFCSNDYLGLANDPQLIKTACIAAQQWGVGSGASHLVSGHLRPHTQLETALAEYLHFPAALTFSSGYLANLAAIPSLVGRGDAVFADKLNHASLIDAVQLSRAQHHRYRHHDMDHLSFLLTRSPARRKLIVSDAVFSMDGDLAPLPALFELAEHHDAWLVIDDAHGFGVLGPQGRVSWAHFNLPASPRVLLVGTLGKAAGVAGAFIAADAVLIDTLIQKARSYIFTTASSPLLAATLCHSLQLIASADERRQQLQQHINHFRQGLLAWLPPPYQLLPSSTAIQALIIGDNQPTQSLADALFAQGIWVPAIRPPTVPAGTARLRISLSAAHQETHVTRLLSALKTCMNQQ